MKLFTSTIILSVFTNIADTNNIMLDDSDKDELVALKVISGIVQKHINKLQS